ASLTDLGGDIEGQRGVIGVQQEELSRLQTQRALVQRILDARRKLAQHTTATTGTAGELVPANTEEMRAAFAAVEKEIADAQAAFQREARGDPTLERRIEGGVASEARLLKELDERIEDRKGA